MSLLKQTNNANSRLVEVEMMFQNTFDLVGHKEFIHSDSGMLANISYVLEKCPIVEVKTNDSTDYREFAVLSVDTDGTIFGAFTESLIEDEMNYISHIIRLSDVLISNRSYLIKY